MFGLRGAGDFASLLTMIARNLIGSVKPSERAFLIAVFVLDAFGVLSRSELLFVQRVPLSRRRSAIAVISGRASQHRYGYPDKDHRGNSQR